MIGDMTREVQVDKNQEGRVKKDRKGRVEKDREVRGDKNCEVRGTGTAKDADRTERRVFRRGDTSHG
jgi:hypothetical protein